jgi:hypothetical protein
MKSQLNISTATPTDQIISTVEDVIAYLFEALRNMRSYPLEDAFQEGYERAFNHVMYHVLASHPTEIPEDTMGSPNGLNTKTVFAVR